jgi:FtsH-binding integral membrane protein
MFIRSSFIHFPLSVAGAFIFALFIIYDTHLVMKRLSAEDYVMGVIVLYMDVINLFMKILKILQHFQQNNNNEKREKREKK